jgi:hypothetical protein
MPDGKRSREVLATLAASAESLGKTRYLPLVVALSTILLALPALSVGWILDDYYHRAVLLQVPRFRDLLGPPSEMFRFFRGDPARMGRLMDIGLFPWWTDPNIKGEFLQALTVLTHRLDYALWPNSPELMHAHNLFWLGSATAVATVFYRRMMGPKWVATVAAFLFAVDDARGPTVGFLANRNALIAATFGVSALIFHDRFRRDGSRLSGLLAPLLLLAALFAKEEGIGTCAYLAAYGLLVDRAGWWRGCLALLPYAAVVVVWRALRSLWGYGVRNIDLYIDPLDDPRRFVAAAVWRAPMLLMGQWTPIPAEAAIPLRSPFSNILCWFAVTFLGLLLAVIAPLLRRDRLARFWAAGMFLAVIPICATLPMDRLLTFTGLGASGLLTRYWAFVFGDPSDLPSSRTWRILALWLAWFFVAVHVVLAPIALPFRAANPLGPRWVEKRLYVHTPLGPEVSDQTLVIVNAPSAGHAGYSIFRNDLSGQPVPRYTRVLAPAIPTVLIRRLDDRTLTIRPARGYLDHVLDRLFRTERRELVIGERVRLSGITVEITDLTADGRPAAATFRFDVPLESPPLRWLCFRGNGFEPFTPPPVGREVTIPFDGWAVLLPGTGK